MSIDIRVTWDPNVDAAAIYVNDKDDLVPGEQTSYPVMNKNGDLIAILDFHKDGRLLEVELLNARTQLPDSLKAIADKSPSPEDETD